MASLFYLDAHGRWIFSFEPLADVRKNCSRGKVLLNKNYPRFGRESNV
jgi:hypothetical protein